jgi:hypothetical protein
LTLTPRLAHSAASDFVNGVRRPWRRCSGAGPAGNSPRHRPDIDDRAAPSPEHVGAEGAVAPEHAVQIDVVDGEPFLVGHFLGRLRGASDASFGDKHVYAAEFFRDLTRSLPNGLRVGEVDGPCVGRKAFRAERFYEAEAYARKKAARLADQDCENGGDGSFQVVAVGESPFDNNRPSFSTWLAAHPHVFDFDNCPF